MIVNWKEQIAYEQMEIRSHSVGIVCQKTRFWQIDMFVCYCSRAVHSIYFKLTTNVIWQKDLPYNVCDSEIAPNLHCADIVNLRQFSEHILIKIQLDQSYVVVALFVVAKSKSMSKVHI